MENIIKVQENSINILNNIGMEIGSGYIESLKEKGFSIIENRVYMNEEVILKYLNRNKLKKDLCK